MAELALTTEQGVTFAQIAIKLKALRIGATLLRCEPGPIVSTYFLRLDTDVPISKILKAEEDIALAVEAPSVLITRSGGHIAIAIPNKNPQIVSFDKCLHAIMSASHDNNALPLMLGVDTKGKEAIINLTESPHVLIAGATGSGKSVFLASIIAGLACVKTKQEMKFILCDTKQLELPLFRALPHVVEVADSLQGVRDNLDRLITIVRQRISKMKGIGRNLAEYNSITGDHLPYYVVVIDELADVLMQDRSRARNIGRGYDKAESKLQQLLQISRAAGIHIICATQRPSVDIITGDIKANMPTRIALRLPSGADSRTVLNEYGAESLLGKGDMLIESPNFQTITRFHGPYISLESIARILIDSEQIRDMYRGMNLTEETIQ